MSSTAIAFITIGLLFSPDPLRFDPGDMARHPILAVVGVALIAMNVWLLADALWRAPPQGGG